MCRRPQRGRRCSKGFFRKDEFRYDAERDAYICPGGQELTPIREGKLRDMKKIDYANAKACRDCPLRPHCTNAGYRAVSRLENEDALDRMAERLKARPEILDRRREIVEHPVRHDQAMDEPGRVPDARPRKGARRVQPDGARLQFAPGAQHSRNGQDDGGGRRLTGAHIAVFSRKPGHGGLPMPSQTPPARFGTGTRKCRDLHGQSSLPSPTPEFPHGLPEFCKLKPPILSAPCRVQKSGANIC